MVGIAPLARMLGPDSLIGQKVTDLGGVPAHPVRAVLFNKAGDMNWALGWHQDRTIAVRQRVDTPGFGPWSVKRGIQHVEPPFAVIAAMLTVRIHIDRVDEDNAPLLVALGSHRLGRIAVTDVGAVVERCTIRPCLADAGDVWIYHTPVVHASRAARPGRRRRVLQVDYASQHLPAGLEWLGI
ncbi:phytanoyl-CoA dioxygenase family protein [Novosphingobium sp. Leaf2]|uniref:phytanoyl-CoA dioxygenase family protein n=1 Tax=Novosphingobium sp. Leaf2 TaxID=1735670 RepID=UPI0012E11F20|nr:phytanoyl-CoA dioxygenase family protein [Novosphingobium sp. Leaf2]